MSRHSILAVVAIIVIIPTLILAWAQALKEPPPPAPPPEPPVPKVVDQRLNSLESKVVELSKPPAPPEPEPPPPTPPPTVRRVAFNGQDLADLFGVAVWKFQFRLPKDQYTLYLWSEQWNRGDAAPTIEMLLSGSAKWGEDELVLKLPIAEDPRLFIRVGDRFAESNPSAPPLAIRSPIGTATLESDTPLAADKAVHLITFTHKDSGPSVARLANAHSENDQTLYIKLGFTRGDNVPFDASKWVTGTVEDKEPKP